MPEPILTNGTPSPNPSSSPTVPSSNQPITGAPSTSPESGQPSSQPTSPPASTSPELTPENVFEAYEASLRSPTAGVPALQQQQGQPKPGRSLNSKRKFDGLSEEESYLFNDMSTDAYNRLYPQYLKSKEHEAEIERLRSQVEAQKESSFFDQEGAWKVTPEYSQYSDNLNSLHQERDFWKGQLSTLNATLAKAERMASKEDKPIEEILQGVTIDCLIQDGKGGTTIKAFPVSYELQTNIMSALTEANTNIHDFQNRISTLETSFKGKHQDYIKTLNGVREKMFKGFPADKLSKQAATKLELFPPYTRNRPEVKFLAEAWVLFDAFMYMLNKNQATGITTQLKNGTTTNNGGAISQSGGTGETGGERANDILKQFEGAGFGVNKR